MPLLNEGEQGLGLEWQLQTGGRGAEQRVLLEKSWGECRLQPRSRRVYAEGGRGGILGEDYGGGPFTQGGAEDKSPKSQGMALGMSHKQVSSQGPTVDFQIALFKIFFERKYT